MSVHTFITFISAIFIMRNLLVVTVLLVLVGCKKEKETIVSGKATDAYSGAPVSGVVLEFAYSQLRNGSYSAGYTELGTAMSDASGDFAFAFGNVTAVNYRVRLRKEGYFFREVIINQDEWKRSQENVFNPTLFLEASIRFRFYNWSSSENQLLFTLEEHSEGCMDCCTTKSIYVAGITDTSFTCALYGNQEIGYRLNRISPGTSALEEGTIGVEAGENAFEVNFE